MEDSYVWQTMHLKLKKLYRTVEVHIKNKHNIQIYHREGYPLRKQCTKSKKGRTINHCHKLEEYHKEVERNVTSDEGIKLMNQRSNETE